MTDYTLGAVESRFADLVWDRAPLTSRELIKLCKQELDWKRTTTYTVLKKLGEQGLFQLEDGQVSARVSREEYYAAQSEKFVEERFDGSLPAFLAAFTSRNHLTKEEISEIREMIDRAEEG